MSGAVGMWIATVGFAAFGASSLSPSAQEPGPIKQASSGWCSPTVKNVVGDLVIICRGVNPALLERLNEQLRGTESTLDEKIKRADDWVVRYNELASALSSRGDDSGLAASAAELLKAGDLAGAERILRQMAARTNPIIASLAQTHYDLGRVLELQFKYDGAITHFDRAVELRPDSGEYLRRYGYSLLDNGRTAAGQAVLERLLGVIDNVLANGPPVGQETNRKIRAEVSNNLGVAYRRTHDYPKSKQYLLEAERLYNNLGDVIGVLEVLSNLEVTYEHEGDLPSARRAGERALSGANVKEPGGLNRDEQERLAQLHVAVLVNLSLLYRRMDLDAEASAAIGDALPRSRKAYEREPLKHGRLMALALVSNAQHLKAAGDLTGAQASYLEAYELLKTRARFGADEQLGFVECGVELAWTLLRQEHLTQAADIAADILPWARSLYAADRSVSVQLVDALMLSVYVSTKVADRMLPAACDALREALGITGDEDKKAFLRRGLQLC